MAERNFYEDQQGVASGLLKGLAVFIALPRALKVIRVLGEPKPESAPPNVPIWPLWYVAWAFILTRLAGVLFIAGLAANAIYPIFL
jgi:hypothetical protein